MLSRRAAVVAGLALALCAMSAGAADKTKPVELGKLFPYLEPYLALPPAERSRFRLVYRVKLGGAPQSALRLAYPDGPAPLAADGRVLRLPTLAALRAKAKGVLTAPQGAKLDVDLEVEPTLPTAAEMDAQALAEAVRQAAAGSKKAAGVFGFAVPAMQRVVFVGVAGGQVVSADGTAKPLPLVRGRPVFDPKAHPGARRLRFARAPQRMTIGPAK